MKSLAESHRQMWEENVGDNPALQRVWQRRSRQALPRLIPDVAYEPVTDLTFEQTMHLRQIRCPIKNHVHDLRLVYTSRCPESGQLHSWLACDQGATYRWELVHGVYSLRFACPHWGWSAKDDRPREGHAIADI